MSLAEMIDRLCLPHGPQLPDDFEDPPGFVPCCYPSAEDGLRACICWEPVYDLEQTGQLQEGPSELALKCCHDCAYRAGSPERERDETERLVGIATNPEQVFLCHQGVRRIVAWRHPVIGEVPAGPGDYRPPKGPDRIWRADGRPGVLCAGWGAVGGRR